MLIRSINPATEEVIQEIPEFTDLEIEQTLARSQAAFESWRETGFEARAAIIKKTAAYLREHKSKLARIITDEVGKTLAAAEAEVEKSATACDYYAENAPKFLKPEVVATDASESYVRFDPIGPVLAIMPWNFPFWQVFRFAAPAIMAGNTGLLKHAISVQMSARAIVEAFTAAGLPDGVFQMMVVEPPRVKAIIQDPRVKAVTLTGSERAGSQVAMAAGEVIKKTVLELGGSDPFIVLADADLDAAVSAAVTARMQFNAGQSCIAGKRFIVAENLAGEFTAKLKTAVEKLVLGDPLDAKTDIGPLATDKMFETIQRQVKESVEKGA
ncbi:MAG TPA: aldehyde dehydrogenase family protein, partial [Candidatus Saccharimonadia bacterium]|nr:aldehyde dehydrogenase family protein [Candidatus Saccharimonadia bacterium]